MVATKPEDLYGKTKAEEGRNDDVFGSSHAVETAIWFWKWFEIVNMQSE
jgi:hypothetical protein